MQDESATQPPEATGPMCCEACGNTEAQPVDDRLLCLDCYAVAGSCCSAD